MLKEARARIKINELIDSVNWTFAKTMPEIPHEYIVIDDYPEKSKEIVEFTELIRANGYEKEFYGKKYRYLNIDNYRYWTIENIINRARLQE